MLHKLSKNILALLTLVFLAGCTVTGEPHSSDVVFSGEGFTAQNEYRNSIKIGEVSNFPGTSNFTYSGKLAPNFSDESFKSVLFDSLKNANLIGSSYTLDAKLVDGGDWGNWEHSLGRKTRNVKIQYTLKDNERIIFDEVIESEIYVTSHNFMKPHYIHQRHVAELNYADNIEQLINKINEL
ncbi:hypothetical protein ACGK9R_12680 [Halomonas sp. HNIBRBA4712]|uniref:hypothetical protein n=1 Tax=Halomonas sp. HNIBRBA4712 TaxID=3373087 RepID=UPI0037451440